MRTCDDYLKMTYEEVETIKRAAEARVHSMQSTLESLHDDMFTAQEAADALYIMRRRAA